MRIARFLAAAALCAAPLPALACSVVPTYRVPTNLELAGQAETIVLARVVGGAADVEDPAGESSLTLRPLEALKGDAGGGDIALRGVMPLPDERYLGLSNPYEFEAAHPLSYIGGCIRTMFPLGTTALFFLRTDHEGMWAPVWEPFSRWAEDVPGPDAPWVELTRLYVRAAALPEAEGRGVLEAERARLLAGEHDPVARLMAADIARQLAGPNEPWNSIIERQMGLLGFDEEELDEEELDQRTDEMEEAPGD